MYTYLYMLSPKALKKKKKQFVKDIPVIKQTDTEDLEELREMVGEGKTKRSEKQ